MKEKKYKAHRIDTYNYTYRGIRITKRESPSGRRWIWIAKSNGKETITTSTLKDCKCKIDKQLEQQ